MEYDNALHDHRCEVAGRSDRSQDEIDHYWDKLSAGGDPKSQRCGWLKDRFGVSWQVVPAALPELLSSADPEKSQKVMQALLQMKKLDIAALRLAAA